MHALVEPNKSAITLKTSPSVYGVHIIKVYPTQQGLWEVQKHPIFSSSLAFISFCSVSERDSVKSWNVAELKCYFSDLV